MVDFQIRECLEEDGQFIYELNQKEMGYEYPLDKTQKKLSTLLKSSHNKIFVAVIDNQVVGYVHANDYDTMYAPHMKNIMGIAVKSEYKRLGIGKALLMQVEKWAKQTNALGVRLVSGGTRKQAHEFYRHCGYCHEKQQINFKKMFKQKIY